VLGRLLLVCRVEGLGWSAAEAARAQGVSRATAYKWLRRFREEGEVGLEDRSSRPHRSPQALDDAAVARILAARALEKTGPHTLSAALGVPRSTIYGVLRRQGLSRLADVDRPTGAPVRYQRDHPGELIHLDTKKLARIPDGGGWRAWGRGTQPRRRGAGYERVHSAIDDRSRVAFSEIFPDDDGPSCAQFLLDAAAFYAGLGVKIQRVMTDRAKAYSSTPFQVALQAVGAGHRPTRPYRPQTNGKVERYQRTLTDGWAYARPYQTNQARADALPDFLHHYNSERPHTALRGDTPMATLVNNLHGNNI